MKTEGTIINVIFDAAKGDVSVSSREAMCGLPLGELPIPKRSGYDFVGWHLGGTPVTGDYIPTAAEDLTLVAHWTKSRQAHKRTSWRRQKAAAIALAVSAVLLLCALLVVNYVVTIFPIEDQYVTEDGIPATQKYYVRKKGGVFGLYRQDGSLLPINDRGYYIADSGNQYLVNAETGEWRQYAVVDYDQSAGEMLDKNIDRILLFEQILQDEIYSIEVDNFSNEPYGFFRNAKGEVVIKGHEGAMFGFHQERFVDLCTGCGYMLAAKKLDLSLPYVPRNADGTVDYDAYGLAERYDGEGNLIYRPTVYTVTRAKSAKENGIPATDAQGNVISYTVLVGDLAPDGSGYYVKRADRDAIFISDPLLYVGVTKKPLEALIEPRVTYPITLSSASMIYDVLLARVPDYLKEGDLEGRDLDPIVAFSYLDLDSRINTFYEAVPYSSELEMMEGYTINGDTVSSMMTYFYDMKILSCKKIGVTPESLREYGLDKNVFYLTFKSCIDTSVKTEDWEFVTNAMVIGQKTENNTYYVASLLYDVIVEVDQYYMTFLEMEDREWYEKYFLMEDISCMKELDIEINGKVYNFTFDNTMTYAFYEDREGKLQWVDFSAGSMYKNPTGEQYYFKPKNEASGYYVTMVDFENGEFRLNEKDQVVYKVGTKEIVIELDSRNLAVRCEQFYNAENPTDPHKLEYLIHHTYLDDVGVERVEKISAITNFRRFWIQDWYWFSLEGDIDDEDFRRNTGMSVEEYLLQQGDDPYATISYRSEDMAATLNRYYYEDDSGKSVKLYTENNEKHLIIRFYRYSERKAMVTIELITEYDAQGNPISHPEQAAGRFYVLTSYLDMLGEDLDKILNAQRVERD